MSRRKALEHMRKMQAIGFYNNCELLPERKVYFAVAHNNFGSDKEAIKRLLKGEKFDGRQGAEVKMVYGYGKLLGEIKVPKIEDVKPFSQYVIYDIVVLVGKEIPSTLHTYHESWLKLGDWVSRTYPQLDKVRIVFT